MRTAGQSAGCSVSTNVIVRFGSQASLAVGLPNTGTAPTTHSRVRSGSQVMLGEVVSATVTVKLQLLEAPERSVAVHVTVLMPKPKLLPEGDVQVTGTGVPESYTALTL